MEVWNSDKKFFFPGFKPLRPGSSLTLRTMAVAAGMKKHFGVPASIAPFDLAVLRNYSYILKSLTNFHVPAKLES